MQNLRQSIILHLDKFTTYKCRLVKMSKYVKTQANAVPQTIGTLLSFMVASVTAKKFYCIGTR